MRCAAILIPLLACSCTSTIWQQDVYIDPSQFPDGNVITRLHVGSSQQYEVLQGAYDNSFDLTGDGDGYFPGVPTNWNVTVTSASAAISVHKLATPSLSASFVADALAVGDASLLLTGEAGASAVVSLTVVP